MSAPRRRSASYWLSLALLLLAAGGVVGFLWLGGLFSSDRAARPLATPAPGPAPVATARQPGNGEGNGSRAGEEGRSGRQQQAPAPAADAPRTTLRGLLLQGEDEQGRRYEIRATSSERSTDNADEMILHAVQGRIERPTGTLLFSARRAVVHEQTRQARLEGDAVIRKADGWRLTGPHFTYDPDSGDLASDAPVVAHLEDGVIEAQGGMQTTGGGIVIRFRGPVHARFTQAAPADTAADAGTDETERAERAGEDARAGDGTVPDAAAPVDAPVATPAPDGG